MKILQVNSAFYPAKGYGGGPIVAYEISRRLVERGHDVTVYTTDANDGVSRLNSGVRNIDGIKVHYFKNISNSLAYNLKLFISPGMISIIKKEIKNFDLIHVHDYRTFQTILVHYYARKYKIPYVLQAHGTVLPSFYQRQNLKKIFDVIFGYRILRDASKVIALTSMEAMQYEKMGVQKENIVIIPNGIDLSEYAPLPERGKIREKYSIRKDEKIVLFLGRIHKIKGIDLLIRAFAELVKELDCVRLLIVGPDDGCLSDLKILTKSLNIVDKIVFTGPLYGQDKLEAYVDADVYVLPSRYETFPVTILEASACGTPIVMTDCSDLSNIVDRKIGLVVQHNENQLKEALMRILTDEKLRIRFKKNTKFIIKKYNWNKIIDKLEEVYQEVVG